MDYQELLRRAKSETSKDNEAKKQRYHLAKSLGFSSSEARVLCLQKEETIRRIAKERDSITSTS